jgi:hypothetical protein
LLVAWRSSSVGESPWEPYSDMAVEVPEIHGFHWTAILLSDVPEWEPADGGGSKFLFFSPR